MDGDTTKEPQYQLTLLWPHSDKNKLKRLEAKIQEVAEEKWGKTAAAKLKKGQLKHPIRDGDDRDAEWMQEHYYLTARSSSRPGCVDADLVDIIDSGQVYAGAIGRMDIWLYAYDKAGNKGVGAIVNNVQVTGEGERKDGRKSAADAFGEGDDESPKPKKAGGKKSDKKGKKKKDK